MISSDRSRARRLALLGTCAVLMTLAACSEETQTAAGTPVAEVVPAPAPAASPAPATAPTLAAATPAKSVKAASVPAPDGEVDVGKLMSGQVLPDIVIGRADAPVTIVEYASMTCDHCAAFHVNTYPSLKTNYLDTGKAKLIIREFPFDPRAVAAFMLARCTPGENGRTAMVDTLFAQGESWAHADNASEKLLAIAKMAGMTNDSFKACLGDTELQAKVVATKDRGETEFGVDSTPTFFVDGRTYRGALPPEQMAAIIDGALATAKK